MFSMSLPYHSLNKPSVNVPDQSRKTITLAGIPIGSGDAQSLARTGVRLTFEESTLVLVVLPICRIFAPVAAVPC